MATAASPGTPASAAASTAASAPAPLPVRYGGKGKGKMPMNQKRPPAGQRNTGKNVYNNLKSSGIRKAFKQGGCKRIQGQSINATRGLAKYWIQVVLEKSVPLVELGRRQTLLMTDVVYGMNMAGFKKLYGFNDPTSTARGKLKGKGAKVNAK